MPLAGESEYQPLTVLAAACAASGQYQDAIAWQEKAIQLASQDREANDLFVPNMKETGAVPRQTLSEQTLVEPLVARQQGAAALPTVVIW